jgi:ubiquitin carboxyl-terminal hydrolase 34
MALWPLLNALISQAVMQPQKCDETLSVALLVFRKLADTSIESVDVESSLFGWGSLLVQHKSQEVNYLRNCIVMTIFNNHTGCWAP